MNMIAKSVQNNRLFTQEKLKVFQVRLILMLKYLILILGVRKEKANLELFIKLFIKLQGVFMQ